MVNVLKSAGEGLSKAGRVVSGIPKQVARTVAAHSGPIRVAALMALVAGNAGCLTEFPTRKGACETVGQGKSAGCDNEKEVCRINMEAPNDPSDLTCYDRTEYCEYTVRNNINDVACPPNDALPNEEDAARDGEAPAPDTGSDTGVILDAAARADMAVGDAVAPTPDAAPPTPDAVAPTPDAAPPTPDAVAPTPDAAPPTPDAVAPTPDAAPPTPDAVAPTPDAVAPTPDAVAPTPDAAPPTPDAVAPTPDAAGPTPDAAELPADAATPMFDLGVQPLDGALIPVDAAEDASVDAALDAVIVPPQDRCRVRVRDIIDGVGNVQTFCGPGRGQVDTYINDYILGPEGVCNRNVDAIATQVWVVVTPNEAVFETSGNCDAIEVFSGERHTDVIPNQDPGVGAERVNFIEGSLTIDGRPPQPNIATYFDVRGTNLSQ